MTQPSHQKIIVLIVFIIAAILSSLFIFHMTHKQTPKLVNNDVTIFNVARNLKDFDLIQGDGKAFKPHDFKDHWTILFFGFTHCGDVCPITMDLLAHTYQELKRPYPSLQVVLVSIDPEHDSTTSLANYTKQYHRDFIGVAGKQQQVRKLQSQFGVFAEKSKLDQQIAHTSSLFLINPQGQWVGLIRYGLTPKQFIDTFKSSMTVLT